MYYFYTVITYNIVSIEVVERIICNEFSICEGNIYIIDNWIELLDRDKLVVL